MDLWTLTADCPFLDPEDLSRAIECQVQDPAPDYRTRLLIRDAVQALRTFWGTSRYEEWLRTLPGQDRIRELSIQQFEEVGFPSLVNRIQVATRPETIRQFLRDVGSRLTTPVKVVVGGSSSLILAGLLHRPTEDLDVVDELPEALRTMHHELGQLRDRYGLVFAHFQSHYLPAGWDGRLHSLGRFGKLEVSSVDPLDVATGKLMSRREKDLDDLRVLVRTFTGEQLRGRLRECAAHLGDPKLREAAHRNWYILFGEELVLEPKSTGGSS